MPTRVRTLAWLASTVALAAALGACPPPAESPATLLCPGSDAGVTACVALRVGAPHAELIHGPQGGWHLDVEVAFAGTELSGLVVEYVATRVADGAELGRVASRVTPRLLRMESGAYVRAGDIVVLDIAAAAQVVGAELEVRVRLLRDGVELGRDEARVTVVDDVEE